MGRSRPTACRCARAARLTCPRSRASRRAAATSRRPASRTPAASSRSASSSCTRSQASWPNPPRRLRRVTGLLLVDKPPGPTSFAVIRRLRPVTGPKVGHAGTLDPFATGLLLVLAGRATRLATFLSGLDKTYRAVVQFGATSTTLDPEGEITATGHVAAAGDVLRAAAALTGVGLQRVPAASAVKVDGERAYARMRRGEVVEPPPREVRIDGLRVEG